VTELAGAQLSNLLETLPGISKVLRSPVADAFVGLIQAASGKGEFKLADVEEVLRYAVRRNLMPEPESEEVLAAARLALVEQEAERKAKKRAERAQARGGTGARKPKAAPRAKAKSKAAHPPRKPSKPVKKAAKAHKKK
jgi:hypothetical protein